MKKTLLVMMATAMMCISANAQNRVKYVYTDVAKLNISQLENTDQTVQLSRYLFAGYNTLCLPMSLSAEQLEAAVPGLKVERLTAIQQEGSTLYLYFTECTSEGIEAGMPYLIFSPKAQYMRVRNTESDGVDTELKTVRMGDSKGNQIAFGSSWEMRTKEGLYGIPAKQNVAVLESVLVSTTTEQSFLPTRCGISWELKSGSADNLMIRHAAAGEVTAIKSATADNRQDNGTYDLNGRRVSSAAHHGIVIQNGKKVVSRGQ